jgi:hypothetical protein
MPLLFPPLLHAVSVAAVTAAAITILAFICAPHLSGDALIIDYDGRQYQFSLDDVTIRQAMAIEKFMGCPFAEWGKRLQKGDDLAARQVLGWLILHPDGKTAIAETDFKMVALGAALEAAWAAEEAAAAEAAGPVPTAAASNGRKLPESFPVS